MENKMMKAAKNMAIGMAMGAAAVTAGAMYINENRQAQKAINTVKRTGKKVAKASQDMMDDMMNK